MNLRLPHGRAFVLLCVISAFAYFSYNLIRTPLLSLFALKLGASPQWIGFIVAASTLTGVLLKLPAGALSDMFGRRLILFLGVFVFAFAPGFYFFVNQIWQLVLLRFFHGLATALFAPVAMTVVADMFQKSRGESLGWFSSSNQLGKMIGPVVGGYLLLFGTFSTAFGLCIFLGVLIMVLFWGLRLPPQSIIKKRYEGRIGFFSPIKNGILEIVSDTKILLASSMEGLVMLASGALMAFFPVYASEAGLHPGEIGLLFGIQGVAILIARPFMGILSDRYGRKRMIIGGLILCAISFTFIPLNQEFIQLFILAGFFGLGEAIATSSTSSLVADLCQARSLGSAMGLFGSIMDIGHASGPLFFGLLVAVLGYLWTFYLFSITLIMGVVIFIVLLGPEEKAEF